MEMLAERSVTRGVGQDAAVASAARDPYWRRVAVDSAGSRTLFQLFVLNILLQIFDGVATYSGMNLGVKEGNPLLRNAFWFWGVGPTLLVIKVHACGLLVLLYKIAGEQVATSALGMVAGVYSVCSFIPWLGTFFVLLMTVI